MSDSQIHQGTKHSNQASTKPNPSHRTSSPSPPSTSSDSTHSPSAPNDTSPRRSPTQDDTPDLEKASTHHSLSRVPSSRVNRITTLTRRRKQEDLFTHPLSHIKTSADNIVDFDGPDDPYMPMNWPFRKKCITTLLYGLTTMGATFASSVYSPVVPVLAQQYGVGTEVTILGISFLLAGFGLGPLVWGPVSEIYGRKYTVLFPYLVGAMFSFGTGAAKDVQTILITRFFTGLFASAPVTNTGGVLSDIWPATQRGTAIVGYAMAVVGGPTLGPIVGGAIVVTGTSWRWTEFSTAIYMTLTFLVDLLVIDESYPPALLKHKASKLRIATGNWALHSKHEEWDPSIRELAIKFGLRPLHMLATPICFFVALYASFVYGILYANLASFPIEFQEARGWGPLVGSLPFLGLLVGIVVGSAANVFNQGVYNKRFRANGNRAVPEARLFPMMGGSVLFSVGLFVFGWTSGERFHWMVPVVGTVLVGAGFITIFQGALNYLIDTFTRYAASAIAANTFLRSIFALAFPIFVTPMYHAMGIPWATSVFAFFAAALVPIPYVFYIYGPRLRKMGKYSSNMG